MGDSLKMEAKSIDNDGIIIDLLDWMEFDYNNYKLI